MRCAIVLLRSYEVINKLNRDSRHKKKVESGKLFLGRISRIW